VKKALSILLLFSISYQFVAKMGIIAWYEANQEYIAKEFCENKARPKMHCNGKCYLKKQLDKIENTTREGKQLPQKKAKSDIPEYITSLAIFTPLYQPGISTPQYALYKNFYRYHPVISIFHPPSVC
jgi:hypothetical protein